MSEWGEYGAVLYGAGGKEFSAEVTGWDHGTTWLEHGVEMINPKTIEDELYEDVLGGE